MPQFHESTTLLREVRNRRVREAFARVDRARFVPAALQSKAWADYPLPIEDAATISQPSLVAKMTEWLDPQEDDRVLEIGTGSGYQTAILAELAAEVCSVEYSALLSETAADRLRSLGYENVRFRHGDGAEGWDARAPYERILSTVAFPDRPKKLLDQLSDGGICLVPVGPEGGTQYLIRYRKTGEGVEDENLIPVRFLSLR